MDTNVYQSAADQRLAALALANMVRTTNARTLREIRRAPYVDGMVHVMDILSGDVKGPVGQIPVGRLLLCPRGLGQTKAQKILRAAGIYSGDRRLRQLTPRQRNELVMFLRFPRLLWPHSPIVRIGEPA